PISDAASQTLSRAESATPASMPTGNHPPHSNTRTLGGFVVDDEDDADDKDAGEYEPPAAMGDGGDVADVGSGAGGSSAGADLHSVSLPTNGSVSAPHVSVQPAVPDKDSSNIVS